MKLFPGNESEKQQLRKIISDLKSRHKVEGRTIRVADKGLNCAENIMQALRDKDGYILSKSVKQMPKNEQEWVCWVMTMRASWMKTVSCFIK